MDAFYWSDRDAYVATVSTRGPWDQRFQHGGPPAALLARAMQAALPDPAFRLGRFTSSFLRPVPFGRLTVQVDVTAGRSVARVSAVLHARRPVLQAQGLFVRPQPVGVETQAADPWPGPASATVFSFPFFPWDEGYHRAVEFRALPGEHWGGPRLRAWARPRVPLVDDEPATPTQAALLVADAESGLAPPVDPRVWNYANPDFTVVFGREPTGDWLGIDAESRSFSSGTGFSEARLIDTAGPFGRSVQSLLVRPRD